MVTDAGNWLFNPEVTFERSSAENRDIVPAHSRGDRSTLAAAAHACFDRLFSDPDSVDLPWVTPCNRLEGRAADTCTR